MTEYIYAAPEDRYEYCKLDLLKADIYSLGLSLISIGIKLNIIPFEINDFKENEETLYDFVHEKLNIPIQLR